MKKFLMQTTLVSLFFIVNSIGQAQPSPYQYNNSKDESTISTSPTSPKTNMNMNQPMTETMNQFELQMAMRKLWETHIVYTRNFIISTLANLPDADAVSKRLLQNQVDIGNAIKPFFGEEAGNKLTKLLREHIIIAVKVVKAAKANNKSMLDQAQKEWSDNAEEIAVFLSTTNSNWNKEDLLDALQLHLDLTTKETVARLNKDWNKDIEAYDKNHDHMLKFSDTLVNGIVKEFPEKFNE